MSLTPFPEPVRPPMQQKMIGSSHDTPGSPSPRPIKIGTAHTSAASFKSYRQVLLSQPLAQIGPRDSHQVVLLRSPLLPPGLGSRGTDEGGEGSRIRLGHRKVARRRQ